MANRISVLKTYKLYIGGKFPRTESGRYYKPQANGTPLGNICLGSRKDFRNAVVAARGAQGAWAARSAFNKGQVLYRIAEILEGRRAQFIDEMSTMGLTKNAATKEVDLSIDRLIYYAGWCDKFQQVYSSVNPIASSHFNFSIYEPTGVVAITCSEESPLLGLISMIAPVIAGGNTCVALASESKPLCAVSFAEVLNSSDVPGGVVNILTGKKDELLSHFSSHMDVNGLLFCGDMKYRKALELSCTDNMKRFHYVEDKDWDSDDHESPYLIIDHQEVKTTWHPIEAIGGASAGY